MRLFFTPGCPYAQRTRALLTHLQQPFEPEEVDLKHKSPAFLALSPTGAVPLLEDGGFVLYESAVLNEYLAEKLRWADAWSDDLRHRARERLAMKRFDDFLMPLFFRSAKAPAALEQSPHWKREVAQLAEAVTGRPPASLLGFHLVTLATRAQWLLPEHPISSELQRTVGGFLDAVRAVPAVAQTMPDRDEAVAELRAKFLA